MKILTRKRIEGYRTLAVADIGILCDMAIKSLNVHQQYDEATIKAREHQACRSESAPNDYSGKNPRCAKGCPPDTKCDYDECPGRAQRCVVMERELLERIRAYWLQYALYPKRAQSHAEWDQEMRDAAKVDAMLAAAPVSPAPNRSDAVQVPLLVFDAALNYIKHVGSNHIMRREPHPQQWIVDGLERCHDRSCP